AHDTHAPASAAPTHPSLHLSIKVLRRQDESAQYTSRTSAEACRSAEVRQGMGAIGSSADKAAAESFNAAFKRETLEYRKSWLNERGQQLITSRTLSLLA
ncbi:hypothetical protein AB0J17_12770, partial [Streptomyces sp. NPDC049949]